MMLKYDRAMKYRMKAAEIRAIAGDDECSATRAALLQVAESYEQMAGSVDLIDRATAAVPSKAKHH